MDIEGTAPAMARMGLLETENDRPEIRHPEPKRDKAAENAALLSEAVGRTTSRALAGDHENHLLAAGLGGGQEATQGFVRLALAHPV
jgi:hypothetical protein